jgi:16S rRNA (uracil1498-N3)-methyltransferase
VTLPLYLLDPPALDGVSPGVELELGGDEGRHAATVRRTRVGERLLVADGLGRRARAVVVQVGPGRLLLRVEDVDTVAPPAPAVVLVQALAKGGRDELAVETATELGVDAVVPWQAGRSVVVWSGERGERSRRRWEQTVRTAAKQARRPLVPEVRPTLRTRDLAEAAAGGNLLVLHEEAELPLVRAGLPDAGELWVAVGPEGGVAPEELTELTGAGAVAVRLGPQVLRSSSAGAAALAVLSVRLRRWG